MDKEIRLKKLGRERGEETSEELLPRYKNLSEYEDYDVEYVSPITKAAHNTGSKIFILLKDWASQDYLEIDLKGNKRGEKKHVQEKGYTKGSSTNATLKHFLKETFGLNYKDVFITNAYPFIKPGPLIQEIPQSYVNKAFEKYCQPQIEIVEPELVVCCGKQVYKAAWEMHEKKEEFEKRSKKSFILGRRLYFHVHHPSYRIKKDIARDWEEMKDCYKKFKDTLLVE